MRSFSIVILAAGESSRLGRPKQLLEIEGVSLIRRALDVVLAAEPSEVIVVLGAYAAEVEAAIAGSSAQPMRIVVNDRWREGMGSSIRAGVEAVDPAVGAVVLMLCDQPHVDQELLRSLVEALGAGGVAATEYDGRAGAPCAFARTVFPELMALGGDQGAREIIRDPSRQVALVPFEAAKIDIDTEADITVP